MKSRILHHPANAPAEDGTTRKSGRAAFTEDGRSIWEWQTATGVFTRTITDEQLASLEATNLRIEEAPTHDSMATTVYPAIGATRKTSLRAASYASPKATSRGALQGLLRRLIGVN